MNASECRCKLGFHQHDIIISQEKSVATKIILSFPNEKISLQHNVLGKK